MRITNQMTTSRMLLNINRNALLVNKYYSQLSTGKKIQNPSDNPIIASRALKFRTNVTETEQYLRNVAQGLSWMEVTEAGFTNIVNSLTSVRERLVQGASDTFTYDDRQKIIDEMSAFVAQIGLEMNISYTGRYVFSGYRTDEPPVIIKDETGIKQTITQMLPISDAEFIKAYEKVLSDDSPTVKEVYKISLPYSGSKLNGGYTVEEYNTMRDIKNGEPTDLSYYVDSDPDVILAKDGLENAKDSYPSAYESALDALTKLELDKRLPPDSESAEVLTQYDIERYIDLIAFENLHQDTQDSISLAAAPDDGKTAWENMTASEKLDILQNSSDIDENLAYGAIAGALGIITAAETLKNATELAEASTTLQDTQDQYYIDLGYLDRADFIGRFAAMGNPAEGGNALNFLSANNQITAYDADGNEIDTYSIRIFSKNDLNAYDPAAESNQIHYIAETGELIINPELMEQMRKDKVTGLGLSYNIEKLSAGDLNPKIYFDCVAYDATAQVIDSLYIVPDEFVEKIESADPLNLTITDNMGASFVRDTNFPPADDSFHYDDTTGIITLGADLEAIITSGGYLELTLDDTEISTWRMGKTDVYDQEPKVYSTSNQVMQYEFSTSTRIQVNSLAGEVYSASLYSELKSFIAMIEGVEITSEEALRSKYENPPYSYEGEELENAIKDQTTEERKKYTEFMQDAFKSTLARFESHNSQTVKEYTKLGSRMSRLELINNRLEESRVSYTALMSENENVDYLEVVMRLNAADSVYNASMKAGGMISQITLADYIR